MVADLVRFMLRSDDVRLECVFVVDASECPEKLDLLGVEVEEAL